MQKPALDLMFAVAGAALLACGSTLQLVVDLRRGDAAADLANDDPATKDAWAARRQEIQLREGILCRFFLRIHLYACGPTLSDKQAEARQKRVRAALHIDDWDAATYDLRGIAWLLVSVGSYVSMWVAGWAAGRYRGLGIATVLAIIFWVLGWLAYRWLARRLPAPNKRKSSQEKKRK